MNENKKYNYNAPQLHQVVKFSAEGCFTGGGGAGLYYCVPGLND